ncbi:hypothetical protein QQP08_014266 [Theobroma cacao]|nr:hypothetical protein QQP08_014266 [Theobroma cacao]
MVENGHHEQSLSLKKFPLPLAILWNQYKFQFLSAAKLDVGMIILDMDSQLGRCLGEKYGVKEEDVILYGQSVGSGPTLDLATRLPKLRAVVLHSPISSGLRVMYPNIDKLPFGSCPVLVIHGTADDVVDWSHVIEKSHRRKGSVLLRDQPEKPRNSSDFRETSRPSTDQREKSRASTDQREMPRLSTDHREKARNSTDKREISRKSVDRPEKFCNGSDKPEKARNSIDRLAFGRSCDRLDCAILIVSGPRQQLSE